MTDTLTLDQLLAEWHLGGDSIGINAHKILAAEDITPAKAAALTPKELKAIRGLGDIRLRRVQAQLDRIRQAQDRIAVDAAKSKPGHCPDCGGLRATDARNVVVDLGGTARAAVQPHSLQLDPCEPCDGYHRDLVATRAAQLVGA